MTLSVMDFIISAIAMILAYFIAVPLAGYFRAWVAKKLGDDTAAQAGYLAFDPVRYADVIGILLLIFLKIGWINTVPVDPQRLLHKKHGLLRVLVAFFSDFFVYVFLSITSLVALIGMFGSTVLNINTIRMVFSGDLSQNILAQIFPSASSLSLTVGVLLIAIIYLTMLFATIVFFLRLFELVMALSPRSFMYYAQHKQVIMLIFLVVVFFFVFPLIRQFLAVGIASSGYALAHLIGLR